MTTTVHVTYRRPDTFGSQLIDPEAPGAALDISQRECGAVPGGIPGWQCTRPAGHDDEHRAVFGQLGDGPPQAVAIAWTDKHEGD